MTCIICWMGGSPPPIQMGCACRGNAGEAHPACLVQWAQQRGGWTKCQTCRQKYTGEMQAQLAHAWGLAVAHGAEADKVAAESALLAALVENGHAEDAMVPMQVLYRQCALMFGVGHPHTCTVGGNLAAVLHKMKKFQEAEIMQRDVVRVLRCMLGPEHPDTMWQENTLALILSKRGQYDEARKIQTSLWHAYAAALGAEHKKTLSVASNLATTMAYLRQFADAVRMQRMVLEAQGRLLGPEHPDTLQSAGNLGSSLVQVGACDEAEHLLQSVLASYEKLNRTDRNEVVSRTLAMAQAGKAALCPANTRVRVRGLVSKPEYNGKAARVVAFDTASGRYRVVLDDGKELLVKAACLEREV